MTSRELIDLAHGPRGRDSVVVPVHDIERTVPLRSTVRTGHRDHFGGLNLRSLDDVLDLDDVQDYGDVREYSARRDLDRSTVGYHRAGPSRVAYHRADVSWDSGDVSYSRSRCGRHRA